MLPKKAFFILLPALMVVLPLQAQEKKPSRTYSLEANPLAYAFGGWSVSGAYNPGKLPAWVFNAGVYAFELPEAFVDQLPGNEGEGWNVNINRAFTLGADYYPWQKDRSGLAFGLSAVLAEFKITNENESGTATYNSLYFVPRASYTWYFFKRFYVMPWLGVEIHNPLDGQPTVGSAKFEPIQFQFSPNIILGYSF
jgi:hypothetical protein